MVEANRYLDEGEHIHRVVEEEPGLDWCLLTSPQATFIQKSRRGVGGEFPLIGNRDDLLFVGYQCVSSCLCLPPKHKALYNYKERLLINF